MKEGKQVDFNTKRRKKEGKEGNLNKVKVILSREQNKNGNKVNFNSSRDKKD